MRNRYQVKMYYVDGEKNTAALKAPNDCSIILSKIGFREINVPIYLRQSYFFFNVFQAIKVILYLIFNTKGNALVLINYPLLGINRYIKLITKALRLRGSKSVALVHDIDSLREENAQPSLGKEISSLNSFNHVISHNTSMSEVLRQNGLVVDVVELGIFDYLNVEDGPSDIGGVIYEKNVVFAGNLSKSNFIRDLGQVSNVTFELYGPGFDKYKLKEKENLKWHGSFSPDELPGIMKASFGLIWDGEYIDECSGMFGRYLRYNSPHKASLYVASKLPLIAPQSSAIAKFIKEEGIGITVSSLTDLDNVISAVSLEEYLIMKRNVVKLSAGISAGNNLTCSIISILDKYE